MKVPIRCHLGGLCVWTPPMLMETSCLMDVSYYPFDSQNCAIEMITWSYKVEEMTLDSPDEPIGMDYYKENGEWILKNYHFTHDVKSRRLSSYSMLTFNFEVKRRPAYYVMSAVIPSVLMSLLNPVVFMLPIDSGEKVSFVITVFLAYAVLLTLVIEQLPSSIEPSLLGVYLTTITIFGGVCVLLTVQILAMFHRSDAIPVSTRTARVFMILEKITCGNRRETSTVKPESPEEKTPTKDRTVKDNKDNKPLSWKSCAHILDRFLFRVISIISVSISVIFVMILSLHSV